MALKNSRAQGRQIRAVTGTARSVEDGDKGTRIAGIGVRWDSTTIIGEGGPKEFAERFVRGAFRKPSQRDVVSRYNHSRSELLGRESNGTLSLRDTDAGLEYEVIPNPKTRAGSDALARAARGDITGSSFEFRDVRIIPEHDWKTPDGRSMVRFTVAEADLYEVGPVDQPAYLDTTSGLRGISDVEEEFERRMAMAEAATRGVPAAALADELELIQLEAESTLLLGQSWLTDS